MEMFWASRVSAAKHLIFNSDNHMNTSDLQGDDESRAYFPCPFCYVEIELRVLCNHLQEEHCFGLINAVCPLCASNLGKDPLEHFTMQHSHSVKRKKRSQKSDFWSNCPTITIGQDFREVTSFFDSNLIREKSNVRDPDPDHHLSQFLTSIPLLDPKADLDDRSSTTTASLVDEITSHRPAISKEYSEQDYEERGRKAAFAQELILSVIF